MGCDILDTFEYVVCSYEETMDPRIPHYTSKTRCEAMIGMLQYMDEKYPEHETEDPDKAACEDLRERIIAILGPLNETHYSYVQKRFEDYINGRQQARVVKLNSVPEYIDEDVIQLRRGEG